MKPSRKVLYAIEAVLDIAYHAGGEPVQSREITRRQNIPRRYLEQTLQQLVHHDILIGVRGPHGGYRLARERRRITVGDIVRVVQEQDSENDGVIPASELGQRVIHPMWKDVYDELMGKLDDTTIDELCRQAHKNNIASESNKKMDFII